MTAGYLDAPGVQIPVAELRNPRAKSLSGFLASQINPHADLVDARRTSDGQEVVVFDVEVEVSQLRAYDIRPRERLGVIFQDPQILHPEVLALRVDFPYVPHLNPRDEETPRSLCLFEDTFAELRLVWTPAGLVERARWWLSETAKGKLHGEDQPLEPILLGDFPPLILPSNFLETFGSSTAAHPLAIEARRSGSREVYVAQPGSPATGFAAIVMVAEPHVHGAIRSHPRNLMRLNEHLKGVGLDLVGELGKRLSEWQLPPALLSAPPIIVVVLPKLRDGGSKVETVELWAFLLSKTVSEVGVAIGVLGKHNGAFGRILGGTPDPAQLSETAVYVLNPIFSLSRSGAAILNGTAASLQKIAVVGLGALGSQVVDNLVRAGFGIWTGIDNDLLLPHNAARHELAQGDAGRLKVEGMQSHVNRILDELAMPTVLEANILGEPTKETELNEKLSSVDAILDMSASLPVARKLAYYPQNPVRRCSVFLNPSGSALIVLCEDKGRRVRLDWLEFQYYRELVQKEGLAGHFREQEESQVRYARSCRALTSRVPQHLVGMQAGIASCALQKCLVKDEAIACVWQSDDSMNVVAHRIETHAVVDFLVGEWRVCTDESFEKRIRKYRQVKLPKETGGVLLGSFDQENRIVYLVDMLPSPPDSAEWPTLYIRGCQGLESAVSKVGQRTNGQLRYVGEWHSHPNGYTTDPSKDDKKVLGWLTENAARDSNPAVMAIVGEKDMRVFVGTIDDWVLMKRAKGGTGRREPIEL